MAILNSYVSLPEGIYIYMCVYTYFSIIFYINVKINGLDMFW